MPLLFSSFLFFFDRCKFGVFILFRLIQIVWQNKLVKCSECEKRSRNSIRMRKNMDFFLFNIGLLSSHTRPINENKKMCSLVFRHFSSLACHFFQSSIAFEICFSLILLCQSNQNTIHSMSGIRCVIVYSHSHTITKFSPNKKTFVTISISFATRKINFSEFLIEIEVYG